MLKVYMDDIIVKSKEQQKYTTHLESIFGEVRKYLMDSNPKKIHLQKRSRQFLGYYLMERWIEVNHVKCLTTVSKEVPKNGVQKLNVMLVELPQIFSGSIHHALLFYKLLRKEIMFEWTPNIRQCLQRSYKRYHNFQSQSCQRKANPFFSTFLCPKKLSQQFW